MIKCENYEVIIDNSNDAELKGDLLCIIEALHCKCLNADQIRAITDIALRQKCKDIDDVEVLDHEA